MVHYFRATIYYYEFGAGNRELGRFTSANSFLTLIGGINIVSIARVLNRCCESRWH
jgi:hypothetical protein